MWIKFIILAGWGLNAAKQHKILNDYLDGVEINLWDTYSVGVSYDVRILFVFWSETTRIDRAGQTWDLPL